MSHGFPNTPRPIATASQPVVSNMALKSATLFTSPLPITGILTAALTSLMYDQSAFPSYICARVRPCKQIALAPAASINFANSTQLMECASQPSRNFTVTGFFTAATMAFTNSYACSGSFINALPANDFTTLLTGHPIFISITSQLVSSSITLAA